MSHIPTSELTSAQQVNPHEYYEEPIHTPGFIQPQGILLALQEPEFTLLQVSGNTAAFIDIEPDNLLGKNLDTILDSQQINYLRNCLSSENLQDVNPLEITLHVKEGLQAFDSNIYRVDGLLILEMEPRSPLKDIGFLSIYHLVKKSVSMFQSTVSLQQLCQIAVKEIRALTGFDRVMMYQFAEEWHGSVIAEDRVESIDSFLGLHFPAADIPEQARRLFRLNEVRLVENVNFVPVPIIPADNPITGTPLDLSLSTLRSVSPIHIEYLQNMGVAASIAIALTKNGKLWGLIACHHRTPKRVPYETRAACRFISQVLSLELSAKEDFEDSEYRMELKSAQAKFMEYLPWKQCEIDAAVELRSSIIVIMVRKADELAKLNMEMQIALDKEKELSELKSRFVSMASHEFRTPLATILSSTELIEHYSHKWSEEKKLTHLQRIQTAVKHMTQVLNDVLLIGKAEAGKLEFKPTPLALAQFCRDLVEEMQLNASNHTIAFCSQGQFTNTCMDEKLLRHIFSNLLSNAIKYSPKASTIHFDLVCEQGEAVFRIQDQGIGIPVADQAQLFKAFHRASNVGTISGTGLGLAIVQKSVDLHGGKITVDSKVGVGTTFSVMLPLKK